MACLEIEELLGAFMEEQLEAEQMEAVQAHLEGCPSCRQALKELQEMLDELAQLRDVPVPAAFDQRLHEALVQEGKAIRKEKADLVRPVKKFYWRRITSIAAVFLVGLFSVLLYNNNLGDFLNFNDGQGRQTSTVERAAAPERILDREVGDRSQENLPVPEDDRSDRQKYKAAQEGSEGGTSVKNSVSAPDSQKKTEETNPPQKEKALIEIQQENLEDLQQLGEEPEPAADQAQPYSSQPSDVPFLKSDRLQSEQTQLENYLVQLDQLLNGMNYKVDSCTVSEDKAGWLIKVTITVVDADGQEIKKEAVYCGQDGELWKKES